MWTRLTWGEDDEEIEVEYDVEPADPTVGITRASVRDAKVYRILDDRRRGPEWTAARYAAEYEALVTWLDEHPPEPAEPDPDDAADLRRERMAE
ncbi:MAG: hypothetical protein ABIL09_28440 [Gemmatimonadota bacterium]